MTYLAEVLADTPAAYYRLNEASGLTINDSSGNGRNGTWVGTPTPGAALFPSLSTSTAIDGSDRGVVTYGSWMDTATSITLEAVIQTTWSGTGNILDRDDSSRIFQWRVAGGHLEFIIIGTSVVSSVGSAVVNDGLPHMVHITYDGTNIRQYVDKVLDVTTPTTVALPTTSSPLNIGVNNSSGYGQNFNGTMSDLAYYTHVLSSTRITAHYNAATFSSGRNVTDTAAAVDALTVVRRPLRTRTESVGGTNALTSTIKVKMAGRSFRTRTAVALYGDTTYSVSGSYTFTVVAAAPVDPTTAPDAIPSDPVELGTWQMEDPVLGEIYLFDINPRTADSPEYVRTITQSSTTTGQPISAEGSRTAPVWTLGGHISTESMLEALTTWSKKPNKIFIVDDFGRTWICYIRDFEHTPRLGFAIWEGTYSMKVIVFGQVS